MGWRNRRETRALRRETGLRRSNSTQRLKRNPQDSKIYSNRAACHTKLTAFDLALKDCDKSIELDPTFVKAYLRKGNVLKAMGQVQKAMDVYEKAMEIAPDSNEAKQG